MTRYVYDRQQTVTSSSEHNRHIRDFLNELAHDVSEVRLEGYRPVRGSDLDTIVNYFWNIALSEALYPALDAAEVVFRNSVHRVLTDHFQDEYWFDNTGLVKPVQQRQVQAARKTLRDRGQQQFAGKIVTELNFGFWVGMLNRTYEVAL